MKNALLLLLLASSLTSCIEDIEETPDASTTPAAVQQALFESWGSADPLTMAPNDFLFQETEQKIESRQVPFFVLQEGITISKKEEKPTEWEYTYLYQTKTFKPSPDGSTQEEGPVSTREDRRYVDKGSSDLVAENLRAQNELSTFADDYQMSLGIERLFGLAGACVKSADFEKLCKEQLGADSCDIACSNLKVTEETVPAPDLIKAQPNCGGLANCSMRIKKVAFDWSLILKKGEATEKNRVNYWISMSPDMPFFARVTEYCFRQLYPVQGQKILVTSCTKLKNFKKGGS
ncbi:hypothetical protein QJS83_09620 [Bdellovibrio sp. 22V]|uniref:hypothetical protein n=1 Tax=Bdellovibrio sp. 22V TaxID=3044166 RepID=UPI00254370C6|nr:hypothetical protein [Bdellovibrio sp. 22V]WII70717.1 hypothetical protein QJS83_09620 [Bdellovibrio sp. 22V]